MPGPRDKAVGGSIDMVETVWRTILPVIATIAILLGLLVVIYGFSWVIEFHL
jgi:hypothetical protein